jgi:hypothetical protein
MSSDSEASEGGFESASEGASPISPSRKQEPDSSFAAPNQSTESATVVDQNQQQQKENPQQQPSGGWGWGSWLSSAVSAVTESLQSDVDSLVSTAKDLGGGLKKITVDSIDRVYETLDAPDAPLKREANGAEQIPQVDSSDSNANNNSEGNGGAGITAGTQQTRTVGGIPTSAILQSTEGVLGAIDRTLDFTSDLLGNAVLVTQKQQL